MYNVSCMDQIKLSDINAMQHNSLEIQPRSVKIRGTLLSWNIVKRQVSIGSFIW